MAWRKAVPVFEVLFAVVAWGASFIATKVALQEITPVAVVWLRFLMGIVILGGTVAVRRQFAWPPRQEWGYLALLGFLGITFHQWLQSTGLLTAQATTTAWIIATTPVFMALLGWLFLKEKLTWVQVLGIALAGLGVLLVVTRGNLAVLAAGRFGTPGDILILISALNWAVFSALSRRGLQTHPAARLIFYAMSLGWLFTTFQFLFQGGPEQLRHLTSSGWLAVTFLGVFCSGLAYIAWYDALKAMPASQVGVFLYLEPLVAVIVAAIVLHEPAGLASLLGGAIILAGVWLVQRSLA